MIEQNLKFPPETDWFRPWHDGICQSCGKPATHKVAMYLPPTKQEAGNGSSVPIELCQLHTAEAWWAWAKQEIKRPVVSTVAE